MHGFVLQNEIFPQTIKSSSDVKFWTFEKLSKFFRDANILFVVREVSWCKTFKVKRRSLLFDNWVLKRHLIFLQRNFCTH